jgi:hypothetical protein
MPFWENVRAEESLSLNEKRSDLDHAVIFCELELIKSLNLMLKLN